MFAWTFSICQWLNCAGRKVLVSTDIRYNWRNNKVNTCYYWFYLQLEKSQMYENVQIQTTCMITYNTKLPNLFIKVIVACNETNIWMIKWQVGLIQQIKLFLVMIGDWLFWNVFEIPFLCNILTNDDGNVNSADREWNELWVILLNIIYFSSKSKCNLITIIIIIFAV